MVFSQINHFWWKNGTFLKFSLDANFSCNCKYLRFSFSKYIVYLTNCLSAKFHGKSMFGSKDIRTRRFSQFYALRLSLLMPYNFLNPFYEVLLDYVLITWNTFQWKAIFFEVIRCKNKFKNNHCDSIFLLKGYSNNRYKCN